MLVANNGTLQQFRVLYVPSHALAFISPHVHLYHKFAKCDMRCPCMLKLTYLRRKANKQPTELSGRRRSWTRASARRRRPRGRACA